MSTEIRRCINCGNLEKQGHKEQCVDSVYEDVTINKLMSDLADSIKNQLPSGVHFSLVVFTPDVELASDRVIAVSTNRGVMAPQVASWVMAVLENLRKEG